MRYGKTNDLMKSSTPHWALLQSELTSLREPLRTMSRRVTIPNTESAPQPNKGCLQRIRSCGLIIIGGFVLLIVMALINPKGNANRIATEQWKTFAAAEYELTSTMQRQTQATVTASVRETQSSATLVAQAATAAQVTQAVNVASSTATPAPTRVEPTQPPTQVKPSLPPPTENPTATDIQPSLTPSPLPPTDTPIPTRTNTEAPTEKPAETFYATNNANVRSCARTNCDTLGSLQQGQSVLVLSATQGEAVNAGNPDWYEIEFGAERGYVYSALLTRNRPAPVPTAQPQAVQPQQPQPEAPVPAQQEQIISTPIPPAAPPVSTPVPAGPVSPFGCNGINDLNCADFRAIGQNANAHLAACGDEDDLDRDGDGLACER